jgi:hypothetical protein
VARAREIMEAPWRRQRAKRRRDHDKQIMLLKIQAGPRIISGYVRTLQIRLKGPYRIRATDF